MPSGIIYKLTNIVNGKVYIGQTIRFKTRMRAHFTDRSHCYHLKSAIKKYGKSVFSIHILANHITSAKLLNELEKYWISFYNSNNNRFGYNATDGGSDKFCVNPETGNKISLRKIGFRHSDATKLKLSLAHRGRKRGPRSPETIEKLRKSNTGRKLTEEQKRKSGEAAKGRKTFLGKHHTEQTKQLLRKIKTGKPLPYSEQHRINHLAAIKRRDARVRETREKLLGPGLFE